MGKGAEERAISTRAAMTMIDKSSSGFFGGLASSYKWRACAGDKGETLEDTVCRHLKIAKIEAGDLIDFGAVYVRGRMERNPSITLSGEEEISISFPAYGTRKFYEIDQDRILFRDPHILIYDKEAGIPCQHVPYDAYNNVFSALQRHIAREQKSKPYAAILHRLDRETSGVLLFGLEKDVNAFLGWAFKEGRLKKEYLAWIERSPQKDSWTSDSEIGKVKGKYVAVNRGEGKKAQTFFRVLRREKERALVLAIPATGRTHQIRIHLAQAGHPVLGDRAYGARPDDRLYLHAWRLKLKHPVSGKIFSFEAPIPDGMK